MTKKWLLFILCLSPVFACAEPDRVQTKEDQETFVNIQRHRRTYFISGEPNTKVQFSVKFPLKEGSGHYFAFTQLLIWELFTETSSPITDANYNPEYFYRFKNSQSSALPFVDFGLGHHSNGEVGELSRSWNEVYAYVPLRFKREDGTIFLSLRPYYIFSLDQENSDARDYRGWYQLELAFTGFIDWFTYHEFYLNVRPAGQWGGEFSRGGLETGVRFKIFRGQTAPHGFLQYFTGYGESLRRYNQTTHAIRVGISI